MSSAASPSPTDSLTALGRLGFLLRQRDAIAPAEVARIEDTPLGVEAAKRAGMRVLALTTSVSDADLAGADLIRLSLAETDLDDILRRLA